jgi:hypothetical protein
MNCWIFDPLKKICERQYELVEDFELKFEVEL